ncbi:MAG: allantoinase AllB [Carbonactinosporaceae bacterium]
MPGYDLVLRARRVLTPHGERPAAVAVSGGRIVAIDDYAADLTAARRVDLGDDEALLPGLVDTHVHVNEPGRTAWEGFRTATLAAAAGGVTTLVDMPLNSIPPTVDLPALEAKRRAARGQCRVDVAFWGGAVPGNVAALHGLHGLHGLRGLHEAGVVGFKCFLAPSGVDEFPHLDDPGFDAALRELRRFDGLMVVHAEAHDVLAEAPACHGVAYRDFLASRPGRAEVSAVDRVIGAARRTGARVHILHLSSAEALPAIAAARRAGVRVSAETCPHYLMFTAEEVPDGATAFKCCPPIRESDNRERLWQALADGVVGSVVSDHSPCPPALKGLAEGDCGAGGGAAGDFGSAWGGIASLQLGLPAVWTQARARGHTLGDVVRWMAERPAALAGLPAKGRISPGYDADFAVFAPDEAQVVDPDLLHHRHLVTPYAGRRLTGVVRGAWLRGEQISGDPADQADQADPVAAAPRGRLLTRGAP